VAYALWFRGIERLPVARVSVLGLLSPVVATAAGFAVLHQSLTAAQLAGAALVLLAVWTGQRPPRVARAAVVEAAPTAPLLARSS
jgi:probable blue pigment (indigoidine) exporter